MKERIISYIKKEPRIWALILFYIGGFFKFISMEQGDYIGGGNFFQIVNDRFIWSAKFLLILPIVMGICIFIDKINISTKLIFLVGSILGTLLTVYVQIFGGKRVASYNQISPGNEFKMRPGLGFWIILLIWIFIVIWTLINDFRINKQTLKENGIKGTFLEVKNQALSDISTLDENDMSYSKQYFFDQFFQRSAHRYHKVPRNT